MTSGFSIIKRLYTDYTVKHLKKIIIAIIISGILISSLIFLDYKKADYQYEKESYLIANYIEKGIFFHQNCCIQAK